MSVQTKIKKLLLLYFFALAILLLFLLATPLLIQRGLTITQRFFIEEAMVESILIFILLSVSFIIFRRFTGLLNVYQCMADQSGAEKTTMVSRLSEAFNYIGTVNVEIRKIHNILNSIETYPRTKKEFKAFLKWMSVKIMDFTGSPWVVIRLIDKHCGRTITEHIEMDQERGQLPFNISNRAVKEERPVKDFRTIRSCPHKQTLLTVCILSTMALSEDTLVLTTILLNQIQMIYLLTASDEVRENLLTVEDEKITPFCIV